MMRTRFDTIVCVECSDSDFELLNITIFVIVASKQIFYNDSYTLPPYSSITALLFFPLLSPEGKPVNCTPRCLSPRLTPYEIQNWYEYAIQLKCYCTISVNSAVTRNAAF